MGLVKTGRTNNRPPSGKKFAGIGIRPPLGGALYLEIARITLRVGRKEASNPQNPLQDRPDARRRYPLTKSRYRRETHGRGNKNRMLGRLVVANTLNGLGIGMIAPLIAYWFALRFGHGSGSIGPALAGSFLLGALGSTVVARAARRYGLIRPGGRHALLLLMAVPLMPVFGATAALFALRSGLNQGTAGVRQALVAGLTRDRRGLTASLQNVSIQVPRALGPLIAAFMLQAGMLKAPFFAAAVLQVAYLALYARFFKGYAAGGPE